MRRKWLACFMSSGDIQVYKLVGTERIGMYSFDEIRPNVTTQKSVSTCVHATQQYNQQRLLRQSDPILTLQLFSHMRTGNTLNIRDAAEQLIQLLYRCGISITKG